MLHMIQQLSFNAAYASERLRDEEAFGMAVVKGGGHTLHVLSPRLRDNPRIVLEAIKTSYQALSSAKSKAAGQTRAW